MQHRSACRSQPSRSMQNSALTAAWPPKRQRAAIRWCAATAEPIGAGSEFFKKPHILNVSSISRFTLCCIECGIIVYGLSSCDGWNSVCCYRRCLRVIKGYEHYREGTCVLFDDAEIARWNQQWDANMIRQEALIAQQQFWPADEVRPSADVQTESEAYAFVPSRTASVLLSNIQLITGGWYPASGAPPPLSNVWRRQCKDAEQQPYRL